MRLYASRTKENQWALMAEKFKDKYRIPTARAPWHDYKAGSYFVTICTQDREPFFGNIVNGEMILSNTGIAANNCMEQVSLHFPHVEVPTYIIMPNHVHAIIIINALDVETQNFASLQTEQKFGPQSKNLASVIRGYKIGVTKYSKEHNLPFAWQPRFHDHIIRNTNEMNAIAKYIENNVDRWSEDCYNGTNQLKVTADDNKYQIYF